MNISRLRRPLFPLLSISAALLISVLTLYAHYWLIPLYEMCKTDHIVNEVGTIARVSTTFVTEPERHRQKYTVLSLQNGQNARKLGVYGLQETQRDFLPEGLPPRGDRRPLLPEEWA